MSYISKRSRGRHIAQRSSSDEESKSDYDDDDLTSGFQSSDEENQEECIGSRKRKAKSAESDESQLRKKRMLCHEHHELKNLKKELQSMKKELGHAKRRIKRLEKEVEQRSSEEEESSSESAEKGSWKTNDWASHKKKYSLKEDKKLLSLISQTGRHHKYKSHGLWEDLAKFNVLSRSAELMRARFNRKLIHRLGVLCSKKECKLFREAGIQID